MGDRVLATGYFARAKEYADRGFSIVSISLKRPWWLMAKVELNEFIPLNPTIDMIDLAHEGRYEEYEERYRSEILSRLNPHEVVKDLHALYGRKVALLCFEAAGKFCHRHIVAKWIEENTGISVDELEVKKSGK